ncbi:MAG: hypothetical protein JSS75_12410 [Bacteroidetes bacterium]|nr:hypothetical protein [Bacteroidota bacterium]
MRRQSGERPAHPFVSVLFYSLPTNNPAIVFEFADRRWVIVAIACILLCSAGVVSAQQDTAARVPQPRKTFTAPDPDAAKAAYTERRVLPLVYAAGEELTPPEHSRPKVTIYELDRGNNANMAPGFYAEFKPRENDTLFLFDSASEHYDEVQIHAGKEIIQGDSATVVHDASQRMREYDDQGNLIHPVKKRGKTNSTVIRSGFIPAQGFGSKRYRFAVVPGNFQITPNSMISASVHMMHSANIGTVLCSITKIDYEKNMFFVEASNEIPSGENINWIIVNVP